MTPSHTELIFPLTETLVGFRAHRDVTLVSTKRKRFLD